MGRLSAKRQAFIEEYLRLYNATQAAQAAGYSPKTARSQGQRLLTIVDIQAAIKARLSEKAMTADEVLVRLAEHARGSMAEFIRVNETTGTAFLDLRAAKEAGKLHLIKSYQDASDKFGAKLELYDAQTALTQLGRAHGLFIDKTALTDPTGEKEYGDYREELERRLAGLEAAQREAGISGEPESDGGSPACP